MISGPIDGNKSDRLGGVLGGGRRTHTPRGSISRLAAQPSTSPYLHRPITFIVTAAYPPATAAHRPTSTSMRTPPPGRTAQPAALPLLAPPLPPPAPLSQPSSSPFGPVSGALTPTYDSRVPQTHSPVIDFDFATRSFPAAPHANHTPTTPQHHIEHRASPLSISPSFVLPLLSPSVPHIAPDVGACQAKQQTATKAQEQIQTPLVDTVTPFALYCSTQSPLSSPFIHFGRIVDNGDFPVGADALFSAVGINDSSPTGHYSRHQTGLELSTSIL